MKLKKTLLFLYILTFTLLAYSQDEKVKAYSTTLLSGISTPLLSSGYGWYISVNPVYSLHTYVAIEGQLSYNYNKITSAFLSGRTGYSHTFNALAGGRLYLAKPHRKVIPYVNLLFGGMYMNEQREGLDLSPEKDFGASVGAFLLINRLVLGASFEGSGLIGKIGYNF